MNLRLRISARFAMLGFFVAGGLLVYYSCWQPFSIGALVI
jgi:hypothetical protein